MVTWAMLPTLVIIRALISMHGVLLSSNLTLDKPFCLVCDERAVAYFAYLSVFAEMPVTRTRSMFGSLDDPDNRKN